jgi:transglutaminase-like putative cysteine protease
MGVALKRAVKAEKLISLLLLFILLTAATAGVSTVLSGSNWIAMWQSLLFGMLIGWALAIFGMNAWRSALFVIILGVLFSLLISGGLTAKLLGVIDELVKFLAGVLPSIRNKQLDLAPLAGSVQQLVNSMNVVFVRVVTSFRAMLAGKPNFDPVAANLVWGIVVWFIASWAGWVLEAGRNALIAVLPALILNLSTLSYGRSNSVTIYIILAATLVLIAVVQYERREQEWQVTKVAYPRRKGRQVGNTSLIISISLVLLAALLSSLSISRVLNWVSQHNQPVPQHEGGLAKSLGIQQATAPPDAFSTVRSPGLPRQLLIGSGPELSKEIVMTVDVKDLTSLLQQGQLPPLYWRSFTYDVYTGHGWSTSPTTQETYQTGQSIQPSQLPDHILVDQIIRPFPGQTGTVYASGEPVSLNITSSTAWRTMQDLFGIQSGDSGYEVESLTPQVSEPNLRLAGQDYPAWVARRYLALPEEVTTRVRDLALQLTATEPTPYDRARAVEQYLRSTFPYTTDVPPPPANQDLADFFLFDLRRGYCDYYASTMVVLARAAGIPARLAIGYATGTYNMNSKRFAVSKADAHSWVEVYFPNIGWVPFEPTASLPQINRSTQPSQVATPTVPPTQVSQSRGFIDRLRYLGYSLLTLPLLAVLIWAGYDEIHLSRLKPRSAAKEIYRRMRCYGKLVDVAVQTGATPFEFAAVLSSRIQALVDENTHFTSVLINRIHTLVNLIVYLSYRPAAEAMNSQQILKLWRPLRWQLRWIWVLKIQRLWHTNRVSTLVYSPEVKSQVK